MGKFRVSVTPYYASLMDPDDAGCPVRMQGVPTPAELVVHKEDLKDAVSEDFDSPTPGLTHRYPDRVLFVVTEHVLDVLPPLHPPAPRRRRANAPSRSSEIDDSDRLHRALTRRSATC